MQQFCLEGEDQEWTQAFVDRVLLDLSTRECYAGLGFVRDSHYNYRGKMHWSIDLAVRRDHALIPNPMYHVVFLERNDQFVWLAFLGPEAKNGLQDTSIVFALPVDDWVAMSMAVGLFLTKEYFRLEGKDWYLRHFLNAYPEFFEDGECDLKNYMLTFADNVLQIPVKDFQAPYNFVNVDGD